MEEFKSCKIFSDEFVHQAGLNFFLSEFYANFSFKTFYWNLENRVINLH